METNPGRCSRNNLNVRSLVIDYISVVIESALQLNRVDILIPRNYITTPQLHKVSQF